MLKKSWLCLILRTYAQILCLLKQGDCQTYNIVLCCRIRDNQWVSTFIKSLTIQIGMKYLYYSQHRMRWCPGSWTSRTSHCNFSQPITTFTFFCPFLAIYTRFLHVFLLSITIVFSKLSTIDSDSKDLDR